MRVHDKEPIGSALRRFKKLLERTGLHKELRKRKHYKNRANSAAAPSFGS